jgi:hypothetical protein
MAVKRVVVLGSACLVLLTAVVASAATGRRVFFLTVKPHQCLVGSARTGSKANKTVLIVPCSNPAHNFEVYGIGHGGWGHAAPPPLTTELSIMRTTCSAIFQRVTGHPLRTYGWYGFAADPGAETARYADKIICSLRTYPAFGPLGVGWHVH